MDAGSSLPRRSRRFLSGADLKSLPPRNGRSKATKTRPWLRLPMATRIAWKSDRPSPSGKITSPSMMAERHLSLAAAATIPG